MPLLGSDNQSTSTTTVNTRNSVDIRLKRNDEITDISGIFAKPTDQASSLEIWSFQPAVAQTRNDGIRNLQEAINEVVSRHRGINNFQFVQLSGVFDTPTKTMLKEYVEHFRTIPGYPYNLGNVGPDNDFLTYIKEDYDPFNPTTNANRGWIVDRRLLIGNVQNDDYAQVDGLWELYEGVVQVFKNQMRAFAQTYLDCNTF